MEFDLFTFIAQIVNFLVLVVLLRVFLYKRLLKIMDEREARIARSLEEAEDKRKKAGEEAQAYLEKQRQIEEQRDTLLAEAEKEAKARSAQLVEQAREEVEESKRRWYQALESEKSAFLRELRERAGRETYAAVRSVLRDLANRDLEEQMIAAFSERLGNATPVEKESLEHFAAHPEAPVVLTSSYDMPEQTRRKILAALDAGFGSRLSDSGRVEFRTSADLICGVELQAEGRKIAWSLSDYLGRLEDDLAQALERQTDQIPALKEAVRPRGKPDGG